MTSVRIALLLALWAMPLTGATGLSTNMSKFLAIFNGMYDNLAQYQADKSHSHIQLRCAPVITPAFPERVVLFTEWSFDGTVLNFQLNDPHEDSDGVIILDVYNFTNPSQHKPGEYKLEYLSKLTPEDIQRPSPCEAEFEPVLPGMYMGTWPDTRHYIKGQPALYTATLTCNVVTEVIPRSATEESPRVPYNLIRVGDKFKVPNAPDGFVSPCS